MAIQELTEKVVLKIDFDGGLVDGKQKIKSKSFSKIKTDATNEDLHGTGTTMAELQEKDLVGIKRIQTSELREE